MATSEEFSGYILDLLESVGEVECKRMFSGVLLKVAGRQLGIIIDDILYFKVVDFKLQNKYKDAGSSQFSYVRKDKTQPVVIKNWWSVPDFALDNPQELVILAEEVLAQTH